MVGFRVALVEEKDAAEVALEAHGHCIADRAKAAKVLREKTACM